MSSVIESENPLTIPTKKETMGYGRTIFAWVLTTLLIVAIYLGYRLAMGYSLMVAPQLHGFVMESPVPVGNFTLIAHSGEQMSLSDFRGQIVLVYFGYTHCPDVCPATLLQLAQARANLKPKYQDDVQVLMVTVDPERDTPALLTQYLSHFDPTFVGLTGSRQQIDAAATPLGIFYEVREEEGIETYFVDHTATVAVLDRKGQLRMVWPFGVGAEDMTTDLNYFVRER